MSRAILKRSYEGRIRDIEAQMARGRTPNRLREDLRVCKTIVSLCEDLEAAEGENARLHTDIKALVASQLNTIVDRTKLRVSMQRLIAAGRALVAESDPDGEGPTNGAIAGVVDALREVEKQDLT